MLQEARAARTSARRECVERRFIPKLQELVGMLVERVETSDQRVRRVIWTPPARPFSRKPRLSRTGRVRWRGAPGRTRTADAGLRTASLCPLSYGGADVDSSGRRWTARRGATEGPTGSGDGVPCDHSLPEPSEGP